MQVLPIILSIWVMWEQKHIQMDLVFIHQIKVMDHNYTNMLIAYMLKMSNQRLLEKMFFKLLHPQMVSVQDMLQTPTILL